MKGYKVLLILTAIVAFNISCDTIMRPSELAKFVQDPKNGLHKVKTVGPITVDLQYKPISFVVVNEFRKNEISKAEYQDRHRSLQSLQQFNLKLSINKSGQDITTFGLSNASDQQGRLYYLSFGMKDDIRLIDGQDTLAPVLYHFERSYDLAGHRTFVLAFEAKEESQHKDKTLVFDSRVLETGPIKITIEEKDIKKIPKLKLL